jgi:hypothetical protein
MVGIKVLQVCVLSCVINDGWKSKGLSSYWTVFTVKCYHYKEL